MDINSMFYVRLVLMISLFSGPMVFSQSKPFPKVTVIGAGLAGLTTAYRLQQSGVDCRLYEARDRVGGRVFSVNLSGDIAELGAQSIADGGEAPILHQLIKEFDLKIKSFHVPLSHLFYDGEALIPVDELLSQENFDKKNLKSKLHEIAKNCHNMEEILKKLFDQKSPIYKSLAVRLAAYEGGHPKKLSPWYIETLFHMINGGLCSVHQDESVDILTIDGGNSKLPEKMAESLGSKIHFNMPLVKVSSKEDSFLLTFKNGDTVQTDLLILAIPCTVFEEIKFDTNILSKKRLRAITDVQYGENAKILIPIKQTLEKRVALITDDVVNFFANPKILTSYMTGKSSFFDKRSVKQLYKEKLQSLKCCYKEELFQVHDPVCVEDKIYATYHHPIAYSWSNDPYARGSYSFISSPLETALTPPDKQNKETFRQIFAPIDNRLFFAGEHTTTNLEILGTMEAACESGEKIARVILSYYLR